MEILYDRAALKEFMDDAGTVGEEFSWERDMQANAYEACKQQYTRLHTEIEQLLRTARNALEAAESAVRAAQEDYQDAMQDANSAEDDGDRSAALSRARSARADLAEAEAERDAALAELRKAQSAMNSLTAVWERYQPTAEGAFRQIEDDHFAYHTLMTNSSRDLGEYIGFMEQARGALYEEPASAVVSSGGGAPADAAPIVTAVRDAVSASAEIGRAVGWCEKHSMQAVTVSAGGAKEFTMSIGGQPQSFPCSKSGMARAYRAAVRSGDADLIARTGAMFEIETIREGLELTGGDPSVTQLGGYHRDVQPQDAAGWESHHIPARSVQDEDAGWLPAISITKEDHKNTSSYSGKQNRVYQPYFPSRTENVTYKQEIAQKVAAGGAGYIEAVRNELYDLRVCTGHKYDGGISAFLDAVIDMIATRGIHGSK